MAKKAPLRCQDCLQFYLRKGRCAWSIPECNGPDSTFAEECSLFTDQNGYAPLLDCDEDQLPAWYRQKELFDHEPKPTPVQVPAKNNVKKKLRKKKRKQSDQPELLSHGLPVNN